MEKLKDKWTKIDNYSQLTRLDKLLTSDKILPTLQKHNMFIRFHWDSSGFLYYSFCKNVELDLKDFVSFDNVCDILYFSKKVIKEKNFPKSGWIKCSNFDELDSLESFLHNLGIKFIENTIKNAPNLTIAWNLNTNIYWYTSKNCTKKEYNYNDLEFKGKINTTKNIVINSKYITKLSDSLIIKKQKYDKIRRIIY